MDTNTPTKETPEETPEETAQEREKLLSSLSLIDRKRVEETMEIYPDLSAAKAIEMLTAFGGL
jgi:hypothetical protein